MSERMKRYVETQKERGFKLVAVWVPLTKVEQVRKTAEKWRRSEGHVTVRANTLYRKKRVTK